MIEYHPHFHPTRHTAKTRAKHCKYYIKKIDSSDFFLPNQFAAKDLERKSKKCEKEEKAEKLKLKKVMNQI